jgi:molecular chaperone DnaK (HSP70)
VSAQDKASGKTQSITITSDKGRLSEEDIERMIREAEENAEADKITRENIEGKNQLESYLYGLRTSVEDTLKDKIVGEEKESLSKAIADALSWLESHQQETKSEYEGKRKEVESVANPIIAKAYQAGTPPSESSSGDDQDNDTSSENDGPTVEEVD